MKWPNITSSVSAWALVRTSISHTVQEATHRYMSSSVRGVWIAKARSLRNSVVSWLSDMITIEVLNSWIILSEENNGKKSVIPSLYEHGHGRYSNADYSAWNADYFTLICSLSYNSADTQTRTLGRGLSNHNVLWKQKILNNIRKFEGCFLTGQASLIGLNVFNSCIVAPWIWFFCKESWEFFCFHKTLWLGNLLPSVPVWVSAL